VDGGAAELVRLLRRPVVGGLACLAATAVFFFGAVAVSGARPAGAPASTFSDALVVSDTGAVTFSGAVHPHGRATTAFFQFGLALRYREPRPPHVVYDKSTPLVHLAPAFGVYSVSGKASGLVPNALYNLRLVARSSAGTVYSPNTTFRTAKDAAPALPLIGNKANLVPASGLVLVRPGLLSPPGMSAGPPGMSAAARLVSGSGFRPLTEARQLPVDSQIDARAGALRVVLAGPHRRPTQQVTLAGGLFVLAQSTQAPTRGLTTVNLVEGAFPGAPTYGSCAANSSAVLQTVRASDQRGSFVTTSRDSSATASAAGTAWDTIVRCDGTVTVVHQGTVVVSDFQLHQTVTVHAGQRLTALAS
jgi:hypothetical protein